MPNWSLAESLIAQRTELAMRSVIHIMRGDLGDMDEDTLEVTGLTNASTIYSGKAHVHNVMGGGVLAVGEGTIDTRTVQISIPQVTPVPHRDDLVKIVSDPDSDLPNAIFRVLDVNVGGLMSSYYSMTCSGWDESRYWGE